MTDKNKTKKHSKRIFLIPILLTALAAGIFPSTVAAETRVTEIYRLSHPAFNMSNNGQNARQPWSSDMSRILLDEASPQSNVSTNYHAYVHPDFPSRRGLISSDVDPFKSEEPWVVESGQTYRRHWRASASNPRLWEPIIQDRYNNSWVSFTKYSSKEQVINGVMASYYHDPATDYIYVKTRTGASPSSMELHFYTPKRDYIWACLKQSCLDATENSPLPEVKAIDSTLKVLNFDGVYDLDAAGKIASLAAWERNTIDLPQSTTSNMDRPHWSPYLDEPNIIFQLDRVNFMLTAYNVDTGKRKNLISYDPATYGESTTGACGTMPLDKAQIYGFSKTANVEGDPNRYKMVILLDWDCSDGEWGQNYVIDLGKTGYFIYSATKVGAQEETIWHNCGDASRRSWYPKDQSIHNTSSPDGLYSVWDHSGPLVEKAKERKSTQYTVPTANVNTSANTITFSSDPGWIVGDAIHYLNKGGSSVGGLDTLPDADGEANDFWIKTKVGNTITLADTINGAVIDLTTTGNNSQAFVLAFPQYCHNYTRSLGAGPLTMYIPEYWWDTGAGFPVHPSWWGSNDSFVIGGYATKRYYPNIFNLNMFEYTFDRNTPIPSNSTHRQEGIIPKHTLFTRATAAVWYDPYNNNKDINYHGGGPSVTDSLDYSQLFFAGTGRVSGAHGRYTASDYGWCQAHPTETNCTNTPGDADEIADLGWEGVGMFVAMLDSNPLNPADINSDGKVNIKDIQICIKGIVDPDSFTTPDQLNQLAKCRVVAPPPDVVNIKDIQEIIKKIINP